MKVPIEKILEDYDRSNDNSRSYKQYHKEIYDVFYEPNIFEVE